jgi:hypothetical protein
MENKSGRIAEVLEVLGTENIRITALTVADSTDFGILRLIVSDPDRARSLLKEHSFTVNITEVISVMVSDQAKNYTGILKILSDLDISVEYTYAYSTGGKSVIILQCSDNDMAIKALKDNEMELLRAGDLYQL